MWAVSKSANCFGLDQKKNLRKNCFKFSKSCVTLRPKREPLQLLSSEGVNHTGHLVLIAHVSALVGYQEHPCPLLEPLPLLFSSFSAADEARELLLSLERSLLHGAGHS